MLIKKIKLKIFVFVIIFSLILQNAIAADVVVKDGTINIKNSFVVDNSAQPTYKGKMEFIGGSLTLKEQNPLTVNYPSIEWRDSSNVRAAYLGWGSNVAPKHLQLQLENGHNLYIDGGNVGIGTTGPGGKLHLSGADDISASGLGTTGVVQRLSATNNGVEAGWAAGLSGGMNRMVLGTTSVHDVALAAGGGTRMTITSGGNVGIGTTGPANKLVVFSTTADDGIVFQGAAGVDSATIGRAGGSATGELRLRDASNVTKVQIVAGTGNSYFNGGNVGIGTTGPGFKLTVAGPNADGIQIAPTGADSSANLFFYPAGGGANNRNWVLSSYAVALGDFGIYQSNAKDGNPYSAGTARLYIKQDGNVGIGTTNPGANKLDVAGNIHSTGDICTDVGSKCLSTAGGGASAAGWTDNGATITLTTSTDNVGIGVSPSYKLDVAGTFHATGASTLDSSLTFTQSASARNVGIIGTYDPTRLAAIWSMGSAYQLGSGGTAGGLYGLSYSYEPGYGGAGNNPGAIAGLGHQMQWRANGATQTAIGTGIWTNGNVRNNAPSQGYIELSGDLPGYAVNTYPTLKTSGTYIYFSMGGLYSGYWHDGGLTAKGFFYWSDIRLKKDIRTTEGLEIIRDLRGVSFNWKNSGLPSAGLIAQEVEKVLPEAVTVDNITGMKNVNYGAVLAPVVESIKELDEKDRELESKDIATDKRIAELEKEIQMLKRELESRN